MKNPYLMHSDFSYDVFSNEATGYVSYVPSKNPYLQHGWAKDAVSKLKQKVYNNDYYKKNKELWKTKYYKYEKKGHQAAEDGKKTTSNFVSKANKLSSGVSNKVQKYSSKNTVSGPAHDTTSTTTDKPHVYNPFTEYVMDTLTTSKKRQYTLAKNIVVGSAGIIGGISTISVGAITANPLAIAGGVAMTAIGISHAVQAGKEIVESVKVDMKAAEIEKRKKSEPVDPKSGFHVNTQNQTEEENLKSVNAKYKNLDMGSKNNCMLCSVTYEIRRRGYDVTANVADYGYNMKDINRWFPEATPTVIPKQNWSATEHRYVNSIDVFRDQCLSQGNDASGVVLVSWKDGGGHAMHYRVEDGNVIISDPQTGQVYGDPSILTNYITEISYCRLDNQEPNYKALKEVCK